MSVLLFIVDDLNAAINMHLLFIYLNVIINNLAVFFYFETKNLAL